MRSLGLKCCFQMCIIIANGNKTTFSSKFLPGTEESYCVLFMNFQPGIMLTLRSKYRDTEMNGRHHKDHANRWLLCDIITAPVFDESGTKLYNRETHPCSCMSLTRAGLLARYRLEELVCARAFCQLTRVILRHNRHNNVSFPGNSRKTELSAPPQTNRRVLTVLVFAAWKIFSP